MTPDELHEEYFAKHPQGNHLKMSDETAGVIREFKKDFKEHTIEDVKQFESIKDKISTMHIEVVKSITKLTEEVGGINRRLDITNGRLAKTEDRSLQNEKKPKSLRGTSIPYTRLSTTIE